MKQKQMENTLGFKLRDFRMYFHNSMHLVQSLESHADTARQTFRLNVFAFIDLELKNAVT